MGRKIVVLNGSPRKKGNTSALVREFSRGITEAGGSVVSFLLDELDIGGCKGCWQGGKDPASPCAVKDDMEQIYSAFMEADIVVLASPLYYWGISGQLKTAIDRLFAVAEIDPEYKIPPKEAVLLMAAEGNEYEESVYWYERLMGHLGWKGRGQVLAQGVLAPGDIEGRPELEKACELGRLLGG